MSERTKMDKATENRVSHCTQEAAQELSERNTHPDQDMTLMAFHWHQVIRGALTLTVVVTDVNSQKCVVFHDGARAYQTDWSDRIIDGIVAKQLPETADQLTT